MAASSCSAPGGICPISLECGIVPRRSVDLSSSGPVIRRTPSSSSSSAAHKFSSAATPAELLAPDGSLNVAAMQDRKAAAAAGFRFGAPRGAGASSGAGGGAGGSSSSFSSRPHSAAARADSVTCRAPSGSHDLLEPEQQQQQQPAPHHQAYDRAPQADLQQLADACRSRDARSLQQLLAAGAPPSAALDKWGNTALHLLLLPPPCGATDIRPAASAGEAGAASQGGGALGWLTGCFGGGGGARARGARSAPGAGRAPSGSASASAQVAMAAALLGAGASVNARNRLGRTPVMLAVQQVAALAASGAAAGQASQALRLLQQLCSSPLADMGVKDAAGRTALALAVLPPDAGDACSGAGAGGAPHSRPPAASAAAQAKMVQVLIHAGADVNAADGAGMTPLMHAAAQPSVSKEVLQQLLELGANCRLLDNKRRSALTHALISQQLKLLPALGLLPSHQQQQQHGACLPSAWQAAAYGAAAFDAAAGGGADGGGMGSGATTASCASSLIPVGVDAGAASTAQAPGTPASCSDTGSSGAGGAAPIAASSSHRSSVPQERPPAAPAGGSSFGGAAAPVAPLPTHGAVIRALCSYGALDLWPPSVNTRYPALSGQTQLHVAVRRGDVRALELLLASGADANALDSWGNSPLMYWPVAAASDSEDVVQALLGCLLAKGADPNLANNDGWVPLDLASALDRLGRVVVTAQHVPVHALLVGYSARNSDAFVNQRQHQPALACMRTDSANSVLRAGAAKAYDSLRVSLPAPAEALAVPAATAEER